MSLVGYKAKNHPQQIGKRGARPEIDDRATTPEVFDPLNERFRFTIDVAASRENTKVRAAYFTAEDDALSRPWSGRVWCNPPHSNLERWIIEAWDQWEWKGDVDLIVMLVPANRTEQGWWQRYVEPHRDKPGGLLKVEFLPGRLRFLAPGATDIKPNERPPYGCCLLIWQRCE